MSVNNPLVVSNDPNMSQDRDNVAVSEHASLMADTNVYSATRRKNYVSGALKNDSFLYSAKAATNSSGVVTFYLTDNGLSTGNAVFTNVYADSISVVAYGSAANYQPFSPVVSGDKKSVTMNINQASSVLLGIIQLVSAASGVDCRLYVMGD